MQEASFKNPIIDKTYLINYMKITKVYLVKLTNVKFKISAAWLIENTLKKNYKKRGCWYL